MAHRRLIDRDHREGLGEEPWLRRPTSGLVLITRRLVRHCKGTRLDPNPYVTHKVSNCWEHSRIFIAPIPSRRK